MLSAIRRFFGRKQAGGADDAVVHYQRANLLRDQGELEAALAGYDCAVALNSGYAHALCNRGVVLQRLQRFEAAMDSFDRAVALDPGDFLAHYNRAAVLLDLKRPEEALAGYDRAIAIKPDYVEAHFNRANVLAEFDRQDAALAGYARSIEINPTFYHAYLGRGALLQKRKQGEAALADYERAVQINPQSAESHAGRGMALTLLRRWEPALDSFSRAVALKPELAETHAGRGFLFAAMNRNEQAKTDFDAAIALKPDYVDALLGRADALYHMKKFEEARGDYDRALAFQPDRKFLLGMCLHLKMQMCDWSDLKSDLEHLTAAIEADAKVTAPFPALSLLDSPALHHVLAKTWTREEYPGNAVLGPIRKPTPRAMIRVGYFSADFWEHPVAVLMAQVLESHDRTRFDTVAFSFGPDIQDAMRQRMEGTFDRFIDVRGHSDQDVALLARSLDIDIAVDLMGHTGGCRTGIFALRAAPIQVGYLGFPGTMGAEYMDYVVADPTIAPEAQQRHFSEKILYLPNSYLPNDSTRRISDTVFTREALGLPSTGFIFCCFNNSYKVGPDTFDSWMRILSRVEHSVLWLSGHTPTAVNNLRREASRRGVGAERLVFAARMPAAEDHLARLRVADLFLDTLPYNAHATAIDALWAGLPILTLIGQAFAGRVGASLLRSIGLPELIASTPEQYENLAVGLAADPPHLAEIKRKLAHNRSAAPLFDTGAMTRHLEAGYAEIMEKSRAGLAPEHIRVSPL